MWIEGAPPCPAFARNTIMRQAGVFLPHWIATPIALRTHGWKIDGAASLHCLCDTKTLLQTTVHLLRVVSPAHHRRHPRDGPAGASGATQVHLPSLTIKVAALAVNPPQRPHHSAQGPECTCLP